jgi:hypothetical protein
LTKTKDGKQNSFANFPGWVKRWVNLYGEEVLRAYRILDKTLPKKEILSGRDLLKVFPITEKHLKQAGLSVSMELKRDEWIRLLIKSSNLCYDFN